MTLPKKLRIFSFWSILLFSLVWVTNSCSTDSEAFGDLNAEEEPLGDDMDEDNSNAQNGTVSNDCPAGADTFFAESSGLISVEFENNSFDGDWELRNDANDVSGQGYMVWTGSQQLNQPGEGMVTYLIQINNPGTYQFLWKSSFRQGDNGTEHNDSWLRFANANDFFGEKASDGSIVYPNGSGKEPNPEGSSSDGWFKIYRSGNDNSFIWQARTSDNDAHDIFVTFSQEGIYTMEVSARSSFHGIDRFLLFNREMFSRQAAIDAADTFSSENNCN